MVTKGLRRIVEELMASGSELIKYVGKPQLNINVRVYGLAARCEATALPRRNDLPKLRLSRWFGLCTYQKSDLKHE